MKRLLTCARFLHIAQNGYAVLFALVLAEALGLPVPAALALLIAGASSAKGPLHFGIVLMTSLSALLLGDSLLFLLGRYSGWWLLGILCKLSINSESCILRSAESFRRHGRTLLVMAKFVPGINSLAPPLAGSMNMRYLRFLPFDLAGASLYATVWSCAGFLFSDLIAPLTNGYKAGSRILMLLVAAAIVAYFGYKIWRLLQAGPLSYVPRVSASEVARHFHSDLHGDMAVFDVRSHGYYSTKALRIEGSVRLEPNTILQQISSLPKDKEIVLYCTCQARGDQYACGADSAAIRVSIGGDQRRAESMEKGGFPVETVPAEDVILMPSF